MGTLAIVRGFVAPPGVSPDRIEILKKAFADTMKDPEFLADAAKTNSDVSPHTGAQTQAFKRKLNQRRLIVPGDLRRRAMKNTKVLSIVTAILVLALTWSTRAVSQTPRESFYQGKTVTILVGYNPGGGYDLYARLLIRHMGKHIPGNPDLIVENMAGAASLVAANHLYNRVKRDGLTFMVFNHMIIIRQLVGDPKVLLDVRKMNWIGSASGSPNLCVVRHNARYQRIEDMIGAKQPTILAATSGSTREYYPKLMAEVLGANFKIIPGYKSGGAIYVAIENGETDGMCGLGWDTLKADRPQWLKEKFVTIFMQLNPAGKVAELPNAPWIMDYVKTPADRQLIETGMGTQAIVRGFVAPPGVPPDRIEILKKAFADTMKDPEFLADAAKTNSDVSPHTGAEIQAFIKQWFSTPPELVQKIKRTYFPAGF
jgi:tripartite-type tricarboxylate transporter receptor subunit TctC